jgi:uncharacterized protein (DUF169 family)
MPPYSEYSTTLVSYLQLKAAPVAVRFTDEPPIGIPRIDASALAGCAYWKTAAAGEVFYTNASDHMGCAIGAYTIGAELGPPQKAELERMLVMMTEAKYIATQEVPSIPVRHETLKFVTYAPLAKTPAQPDLVVIRSRPRASMLLSEAAHAAGVRDSTAPVIRPACAMLPQVLSTGRATTSLGCIGNRVYTGLPDDEIWHTLPGARLEAIMETLTTVVQANRVLSEFHQGRVAAATI